MFSEGCEGYIGEPPLFFSTLKYFIVIYEAYNILL